MHVCLCAISLADKLRFKFKINFLFSRMTALTSVVYIYIFFTFPLALTLHLEGTWNSKNFFVFLAKFGFQKTDPQKLENTQGYIYGNITSKNSSVAHREDLTLVVVDSEYFVDFYGNRTLQIDKVCQVMFQKINTIAFDYVCKPQGVEDFLRAVPCPVGRLCSDEDNPQNVVPGYQFTYKVRDTQRPRFWYFSIVSCSRDRTKCQWLSKAVREPIEINYDIWVVNGNPSSKGLNPFEHQFSFELHDVFEIHLVAFLVCSLLLLLWVYALIKQKHLITKLLTVVIGGELFSIFLNLIHVAVFAFNGEGVDWMSKLGTLVDIVVQCLFMMFLLLLAKGWAITTNELKWKSVLFGICGAYTLLNLFLYIWNLVEIDNIISNTDEWQTWPGYATLAFRLVVLVWFIVELRRTFLHSSQENLNFVQHFGAFFMLWFIYLPALALITSQVSELWRYKTILSISYAVDILAYAVMIHLFWPSRSVLYMVNGEPPLPTYDLEITGILDDIQETTLFNREEKKKMSEDDNEESLKRNGDARHKRVIPNGSGHKGAGSNGLSNRAYKEDQSDDG